MSACNIARGNMHSNKMVRRQTQELAEFQFGVWDMGQIVDLMEDAFEKNANDGERLLDEQFMMNIFEPIEN